MTNQYIAEIRVFGFNFAPQSWAKCNGALVSISQNSTMFAVIGTTYGGDGVNTFGLPALQDHIAVGAGAGPGLRNWAVGDTFGEDNHTLLIGEVPSHTHHATAGDGVAFGSQTAAPTATSYFGRERGGAYGAISNTQLQSSAIGVAGGSQPHANNQPTLVMNYSIALFGIFPTRN
jgi:microcystin-dependent protein